MASLDSRHLEGCCPACGMSSLFVGNGGHITCGVIGCKDPCIVDKILRTSEIEHIVIVGPEGFDVQHPLRERVEDELFDCGLHAYLKGLDGPPAAHGRYRVFDEDGRWRFFLIGEGVRGDG